jgi:hypothetical protein
MTDQDSKPPQHRDTAATQSPFDRMKTTFERFADTTGGNYSEWRGLHEGEFDPANLNPDMVRFAERYIEPIAKWLNVDSGNAPSSAEWQKHSDSIKNISVDFVYRHWNIRFHARHIDSKQTEAKVAMSIRCLISPTREFIVSLSPKGALDRILKKSTSVVDRIDLPDYLSWMLSNRALESYKNLPRRSFDLRFNLPTLEEMFNAQSSEREIGENLVNDWRVRECLLELPDVSLRVGHKDWLLPTGGNLLEVNQGVIPGSIQPLKMSLDLAIKSLDVLEEFGLIVGPTATIL